MANARGKAIDKTHLSIDTAEERGFIHRDYLAHCHRWSHVVKHLYKSNNYSDAVILDIGCGKEVPLAKLLYSNKLIPKKYIGVDVNKLELPEMLNRDRLEEVISLHGQTDFCEGVFEATPNVITCFEVLEHVEPKHSIAILTKIREVMSNDGYAFISTPCFNGKAAANHVNEITFKALGRVITELGFGIENVFGTFASQRDLEPVMDAEMRNIYEELKNYYDSNVLSTIFAPLFPEQSRNALWVLRKGVVNTKPGAVNKDYTEIDFGSWDDENELVWTSSEQWRNIKPE